MDLKKMLDSKEYKLARARIELWHSRIGKGKEPEDAIAVRDEKAAFFEDMMKKNPELYTVFRVDDKALSEAIYKKLTGKDIILD